MKFTYHKEDDTLTIAFDEAGSGSYEYMTEGIVAVVDEEDELAELVIHQAKDFIAGAIAAGVAVENQNQQPEQGMVWYDADSSMISAFGYDKAEKILEVAFHRTGVYRYYDVPQDVFEGLRDASSKGSYMRSMIIDVYDYEKKRGR